MKRQAAGAILVLTALTLIAPSCVGRGGGNGGDFRAMRVAGAVTVQTPGAAGRALRQGETVPTGAALKTGRGASVRLESGGRAIELAGDTEATLLSASRISLELGRTLLEMPGARTLSVDSRGVLVRVTGGAGRIERALGALRIGVYSGAGRVELLGRGVDVPHLREFDVAGGILIGREPRPLQLRAGDPWDRRLLGDVIELDGELSQFGRGFNAEFGGATVVPEFFAPFIAVSTLDVPNESLRSLDPADVLIGLVFAQRLAARAGDPSRLKAHFDEVRRLFNQGATWGLIAKEKGLDLPPLLRAVLDAIRRGTTPPAASSSSGGGGGTPRSTSSPRPSGSPRPRPSGSPSPGPSPSPTPTPCDVLDQLLDNCTRSSGSSGPENPPTCSVLGILLDPEC